MIEILSCRDKQIKVIENLPEGLEKFYCSKNKIEKIENLPEGLKEFDCEGGWGLPYKFKLLKSRNKAPYWALSLYFSQFFRIFNLYLLCDIIFN